MLSIFFLSLLKVVTASHGGKSNLYLIAFLFSVSSSPSSIIIILGKDLACREIQPSWFLLTSLFILASEHVDGVLLSLLWKVWMCVHLLVYTFWQVVARHELHKSSSISWFLRQSFSLNLELVDLVRLRGQQALVILLSLPSYSQHWEYRHGPLHMAS